MINKISKSIVLIWIVAGCSSSMEKEQYCREYALRSQIKIDSLSENLSKTQQLLKRETQRANKHTEMYMELKMKYGELSQK